MTNSAATYTRNIIVDFPDWAGAAVCFYLRTYFAAAGVEGFPKKEYALLLDGTGQGMQALPVPDNTGEAAWAWRVKTPDNNNYGGDDTPLTLAYGADLQLAAWLASAQSGETPASLDDYFVLKTGDTMTGPLDFSGTDHAGVNPIHLTTAERDALTPTEGMFIYNETDSVFQAYQGGAWVDYGSGGGGAVDSVFGRTGAVEAAANDYNLAEISSSGYGNGSMFYSVFNQLVGLTPAQVLAHIGAQAASAKLTAIAGLTWAANSIILLTGTGTAAVQALAAHVITLLQSASAADARTAIGAAAASDLTTHEGLSVTAHGGILPEDAGIVAVASGRDLASADAGKFLKVTATAALNCPDGLDEGLQCAVASLGGTTTITATTTLQYLDSGVQTAASGVTVNTQCTLIHLGSNVWLALGDVTVI